VSARWLKRRPGATPRRGPVGQGQAQEWRALHAAGLALATLAAGLVGVPAPAAARQLERHDVALEGRLRSWVALRRGVAGSDLLALVATDAPAAVGRATDPASPAAGNPPVADPPAWLTLVRISAAAGGRPGLEVRALVRFQARGGESLVALDLDGDGGDEVLLARAETPDAPAELEEIRLADDAAPVLVPRLSGRWARADARVTVEGAPPGVAEPWCAARSGELACWRAGSGDEWVGAGRWRLPLAVERRGRRLEISSPRPVLLPRSASAAGPSSGTPAAATTGIGAAAELPTGGTAAGPGSPGLAGTTGSAGPAPAGWDVWVGPQSFGGRRLRIERRGEAEAVEERWARLPGSEEVLDARLVADAEGQPLLLLLTIDRTRMNVFGKQLLRVVRPTPDRTRAGIAPLAAYETPFYRWSPVDLLYADHDGDGRRDVVLVGSKGLSGKELEVWRLAGRSNGSFAAPVRAEVDLPGVRSELSADLDGDRLPDLVSVSRGTLTVRRGLAGERPIDRREVATLVLDAGGREQVTVTAGSDGTSVERSELPAESDEAPARGSSAEPIAAGASAEAEIDPELEEEAAQLADEAAEEAAEELAAEDGEVASVVPVRAGLTVLDLDGDGRAEVLDWRLGQEDEADRLRVVWLRAAGSGRR
jgi:hypothetical protein